MISQHALLMEPENTRASHTENKQVLSCIKGLEQILHDCACGDVCVCIKVCVRACATERVNASHVCDYMQNFNIAHNPSNPPVHHPTPPSMQTCSFKRNIGRKRLRKVERHSGSRFLKAPSLSSKLGTKMSLLPA
jgi:hypothetical protein